MSPIELEDFATWAATTAAATAAAEQPRPTPPPIPRQWSHEHLTLSVRDGVGVATPAAPWDACTHCRGLRYTVEAHGGYEYAVTCRCELLHTSATTYTRAHIPAIAGRVGQRLSDLDWSRIDGAERVRERIEAWARGAMARTSDRPIIVLCGPPGTGKTHIAAALTLHACVTRPHARPAWLRWSRVLDVMGRMSDVDPDEQERRRALRARLDASGMVVIDELTTQGGEWGTRELERIVSTAVDERRPLIVTTNESPAQARAAHGDRAWSRIAGAGEVVDVRGFDYRLTGPRK